MGDQILVTGYPLLGCLVLIEGIRHGDAGFAAEVLLRVDLCLPFDFHLFGDLLVRCPAGADVLVAVELERDVPVLAVSPFDDGHDGTPCDCSMWGPSTTLWTEATVAKSLCWHGTTARKGAA